MAPGPGALVGTMPKTLYDAYGRPVDQRALRDEHSGPTTTGVRSIWSTHQAGAWTPQRLAAVLREAEQPGDGASERYVELAEHMEETHLHYLGLLSTRRRQVAQIGVTVEPASDAGPDVDDADLARQALARDDLEDDLADALDAVGKGYSVAEIDWETSERQWMPRRLQHRLPQWFDWDRDTGTELLLRSENGYAPLAPYKYLTLRLAAKSGLPIRGGLARCAAWAWIYGRYGLRDWMRFAEAYGHPLRLGRYPPGADPDDRAVLWRAVRDIGVDAAAIIPEGMSIEWVQDRTVQGRSEIYRELLAYLDSRLSIAVLGQTLTTEAGQGGSGSYALGQVHDRVREDIERSDARQLAAALRRDLVIPLITLNRGTRKAYPRVVIERETPLDLDLLGQTLERLVPLGLRVRADEVRTRLRLQTPDDDDEVLEPPMGPVAAARSRPGLPALARAGADPLDAAIDAALDALDDPDALAPVAEALARPLLDAAAGGDGELRGRLAARYPDLDPDRLQDLATRVLFVADTWGRLTAHQ